MKTMFGKLVKVSLLTLLIASMLMVTASYFSMLSFWCGIGDRQVSLSVLRGQASLSLRHDPGGIERGMGWKRLTMDSYRLGEEFDVVSFGFSAASRQLADRSGRTIAIYRILMPLHLMTVSGILLCGGAWWWNRRTKSKHRPRFACAGCGYDLRKTMDRCPECGLEHASLEYQPHWKDAS